MLSIRSVPSSAVAALLLLAFLFDTEAFVARSTPPLNSLPNDSIGRHRAFVPLLYSTADERNARMRKESSTLKYLHCFPPESTAFVRPTKTALQSSASLTPVGGDTTNRAARRIIIAGAPASGKGTQCERIKERFNVVHLSTGDMLRAAVAAGTEVGREAKAYMDSGNLVPDATMIGVVKDRLKEDDCQTQGWLLDGFPRTQAQAVALAEAGIEADCFIFLNVPDAILVERVVGRRTDPVTGKIYHMSFSPPENDEIRSRLVQRSDDTEEKVSVRLEQFRANVEAVKGSYADISVSIDGNQAPSVVSDLIFEAIDSLVAA